ncbi:MAG: exo-alpha-sialidase [Candidatus Hydrogenedentes bacterium]|nr:exo-alpha-sialidase [Candidatus Hydrogenedentota bacterium]
MFIEGLVLLGLLGAEDEARWIEPRCTPLECTKNGPFVQLDDGALLGVDGNVLCRSTDGGKTWANEGSVIDPDMDMRHVGHTGQILRTKAGTLVVLFLDLAKIHFKWNRETHGPEPDCHLALFAIRSTDGGATWTDKQQLLGGYNADFMGFIQLTSGRLVMVCEHLVPELRRWVSTSFVSDDDGATWQAGNWIDLGGHGHHDGAVEPACIELKDGRVMMLIRTCLDRVWRAYSEDGRYWRELGPTEIAASSAPGWLCRLASGRIAYVYNPLKGEDMAEAPRSNSADPTCEFPASWFRGELRIVFSDDDGKTWGESKLLARHTGGQLAYPYMFERTPGELWIFTRYTFDAAHKPAPPLQIAIQEKDFQ